VKPRFELLDHTADVAMKAFGSTLEELFENAAAGMISVLYDPDTISADKEISIEVSADEPEDLLVIFLNEILYTLEVEHFVPRRVVVSSVAGGCAKGVLSGCAIPPGFEFSGEIKAVTYHELTLERVGEGFEATVLFDV